jgi:hypothetical protein
VALHQPHVEVSNCCPLVFSCCIASCPNSATLRPVVLTNEYKTFG